MPRPRLILEANISKLPNEGPKEMPSEEEAVPLSPEEQKAFNHQTSNILLLKICPVVGNLDYLRKLDKAAVQFQEDALQWTWTAAMADHNSSVGTGLPLGYLYYLIDQLKTVGYTQVGEEPEEVDSEGTDKRTFVKHIYTFEQPAATKSAKVVRM